MKKYKHISKLVLKKSNSFFIISIIMFIVSSILISTTSIVFTNQYLQIRKDFINNYNVKMIEIKQGYINGKPLDFDLSSKEKIAKIIKKKYPNIHYSIVNQYKIHFAIMDIHGNSYDNIIVLDNIASRFLKGLVLEEDTIYTSKNIDISDVFLHLPKMNINNHENDNFIKYKVKIKKINYENNPFMLYRSDRINPPELINLTTCKKIIQPCYLKTWNELINIPNVNIGIEVEGIYIFTDNLRDVEPIAKILNGNKYITNYVFNSFDDFSRSMDNSTKIFSIIALVVLIGTIAYLILSFSSYLKIQQKDIGILKQLGFKIEEIRKIYSRNINSIFTKILVFIQLYIIVIGLILLPLKYIGHIFPILVFMFILLFSINRIIVLKVLNNFVSKNILDLLKTNKEFE